MHSTTITQELMLGIARIVGSCRHTAEANRLINETATHFAERVPQFDRDAFVRRANETAVAPHPYDDYDPSVVAEYVLDRIDDGTLTVEQVRSYVRGDGQSLARRHEETVLAELGALGIHP